ncbi:MAG TPA: heparan-alpha-glucosaminide N-acetyltransferase domain-containing protein [Terriglobales bacterium]
MNSPTSSRLIGIDLARVFAIAFMVQGHAIDVLLAPEFRTGSVYNTWLFLRGLTAPMFLVLAGFSFTVATTRKWEMHSSLSTAALRRMSRFLLFIVLGYAMHMPMRFPGELRVLDAATWQSWMQVDVLQCLGVTLLVLQVLVLVCKTPETLARVSLALACCIVVLTPAAWHTNWNGALSAYMNGNSGSLFPLFPWAAFILTGPSLALLFTRNTVALFPQRSFLLGVVLITLASAFQRAPWTIYHGLDFWRTSPNLFLMKLGSVCILLGGIGLIAKWWLAIPVSLVRTIAQKSLVIYIVHLAVLYGSAWNSGLRQFLGPTLGVGATATVILALLTIMFLTVIVWDRYAEVTPNAISSVRRVAFGPRAGTGPKLPRKLVVDD